MKKTQPQKETKVERPRRAKVSEEEALKRMKAFSKRKERFQLLEQAGVEVYLPDLQQPTYQNLLRSFEEEFTYTFGGESIVRG